MRITYWRTVILCALVSFVAVLLPGAWEYLTVRACLETGIMTPSGAYCPLGSERVPLLAVQWLRVPTVASVVMALIVGVVVGFLFTLRDRRRESRVAA
jgi:hypothetical protein